MAQCRMCGRRGLFVRVDADGFCPDCLRRKPYIVSCVKQHAASRERIAREYQQSEAIKARLIEANALPLDQQIAAYRDAIDEYQAYFGRPEYHYEMRLAELLWKFGRRDESWGMLNALSMRCFTDPDNAPSLAKIRWAMYEQTKAEGRWLHAVELHACYYVLSGTQVPASYLKVMRPMAKKAGLTTDQICAIEALVRHYVDSGCTDENCFCDDFRRLTYLPKNTVLKEM